MMMKLMTATALVMAIVVGGRSAQAQTSRPGEPRVDDILALQVLRESGAEIYPLGEVHGLFGWLATKDGKIQVLYSTKDNKGVVNGILFGPNGENETARQLAEIRERGLEIVLNQPPGSVAPQAVTPSEAAPSGGGSGEQIFSEAEESNWFAVGSEDAPPFYVMIDPRCPFCKQYWDLVKPFVDSGRVQARIIMVYTLGSVSRRHGAHILAADDPAAAWAEYTTVEDKDTLNIGPGDPEIREKVFRNTRFMERWQIMGPPFTIYRDATDGQVKILSGVPEDIDTLIQAISP